MKKIDLTKGEVKTVLRKLALPIVVSSILQFTYHLVDMIWVGGLGSNAVASIGSSSFYIGLGYSINTLVLTGTGIKVAHALGKKDELDVKKYINAGIVINTIISVAYILVFLFLGKSFLSFLNLNNREVERHAYIYLAISMPMMFIAFANVLYSRIFGSFGNNSTPLKINAVGIIINIILDPIFIYTLNLNVIGAAVATLVSNIVMFIIYRLKAKGLFQFDYKIGINKKYIIEILRLGYPMAFQRVFFTTINIVLARIIGSYGANAIAAQKIALQIESIMYMVVGGMNGAIASFTGQNFGAKNFDRIKDGYKTSIIMGTIYTGIIGISFWIIPRYLVRIFIRDEITINIAVSYLRAISFSQIFVALEIILNGLFTGIGKPKIPATISITFTALKVPMAIFLSKTIGLNGVWISISISSILKGIISYLVYKLRIKDTLK